MGKKEGWDWCNAKTLSDSPQKSQEVFHQEVCSSHRPTLCGTLSLAISLESRCFNTCLNGSHCFTVITVIILPIHTCLCQSVIHNC